MRMEWSGSKRNGHLSVLLTFICTLSPILVSSLQLALPASLQEIRPTLSVYSAAGSPQCFVLDGGRSSTTRDLARIADGHGAWKQSSRLIFVTHGFRDNSETPWLHIMKNAMVADRQHQTVIIVGWGDGAGASRLDVKYRKATANIQPVGEWLGEIVAEIKKIRPELIIWGIGHSLGAHLMGIAARKSSGAFDRITGLDPAGPLLEDKNADLVLRRTDAKLVDVIHSDGCNEKLVRNCWVAPNNHYGTLIPLGTIDFYPNYGHILPVTHPLDIDRSHRRAVDLFIISAKNKGLFRTNETLDGSPGFGTAVIAIRQNSVMAEMGYYADTGFLPGPTDARVNFYISKDTMNTVERLTDAQVNPHARHRRDLAKAISCSTVPNSSTSLSQKLTLFTFSNFLSLLIGVFTNYKMVL